MNISQRAFYYVTRKKGKSLLLLAILLAMGSCVLTGLAIWRAAGEAQLELRQSLGGRLAISVDWQNSPYVVEEKLAESYDEASGKTSISSLLYSTKQLTPENIAAIKGVAGVKYCSGRFEGLTPLPELSLLPGTVPIDPKYQGHTKTLGVYNSRDDELFSDGSLQLTAGRHLGPDDRQAVLISEDLAAKSELQVGDYLTVRCYSPKDESHSGATLHLQIVGLFAPKEVEAFGKIIPTYDKIQNLVFIDLPSALAIDGSDFNYGFSALSVGIEDPAEMARVLAEIQSLPEIDWQAFTVEADNEAYLNASAPLNALSELLPTLLAVIILVSGIILTLILTLWSKSRLHETGVLLSLGFSKAAIIGQYLLEVLLLAVLAFGLSYFSSCTVAEQIGNQLLAQSLPAENEAATAAAVEFGAKVGEAIAATDGIKVAVEPFDLAMLYLIGLGVIIAAVCLASVPVMRLRPREILSKMS